MSDWITVEDATRRFGISRATLYRLIGSGQVMRAKRAGDARAYVSARQLAEATTLRATGPKGSRQRRRAGTRDASR